MKKFLAIIMIAVILLSALLVTSCKAKESDPNVPKGMKLASDKELTDYSLFVPEGWIVDVSTALTAVRVSEGDSSSVTVSAFTNASIPESEDILTKYWEAYEKDLANIFDKDDKGESTYKPSGEPVSLTVTRGDKVVPAIKYTYTGTLGGNELSYIQLITYRNGYFYLMTFTTTVKGAESHKEAFDSIISNFRLD